MSSANRRHKLTEQVAKAFDAGKYGARNAEQFGSRSGLRSSIAYGSMVLLTANPILAGAAGLGEVVLKSQLGQPLHATVPLTLGPGESVSNNCIQPAPASGNFASPPNMRVLAPAMKGPGTYEIRVTTANPLHEPMYELALMIKCQGNAMLVRQYVLMLDLPGMPMTEVATQPTSIPARTVATPSTTTQTRATDRPVRSSNAPQTEPDPSRALPATNASIAAGGTYRVARGDTLSTIARRVQGRLPNTTWGVASQIFADNPRAFIRNDPDIIKLGSVLRIPEPAVLAAMTPGTQQPLSGRATPNQSTMAPVEIADSQADLRRAPAPQPEAPSNDDIAITRETNVALTQPLPAESVVVEPESPVVEDTGSTPVVAAEPLPVEVAPVPVTTLNEPPASASPFADEMSTASNAAVVAPLPESATPPVSTVTVTEATDSSRSTSLLAILIGLALGAALSLVILRGRLLTAIGLGRRLPRVARDPSQRQKRVTDDTNAFDQSLAAAAFDRTAGEVAPNRPLPVTAPPEETYIVEHVVAEPTQENDAADLQDEPAHIEPVHAVEATPEVAPEPADDDSAELAALFDTGTETDDRSPTTDTPQPELESLELTAEMPVDAMADIFDPTGGVDDWSDTEVDESLLEAFDENLTDVDSDETLETGKLNETDLDSDLDLDPLAATVNVPVDGEPMGIELDDLPVGDDLSETLQEALELLERDYEDEFTASQIIERAELEKELQKDREQMGSEEIHTENSQRKIS